MEDSGHTADRFYEYVQKSKLVNAEISGCYYWLGEDQEPDAKKIIQLIKAEGWLGLNYDIGHTKTSSWKGVPLSAKDDPATTRTNMYGGAELYAGTFKIGKQRFMFGPFVKGHHDFGSEVTGLGGGLTIKDFPRELVKIYAGIYPQFGSIYEEDNHTSAIAGFDLHLSKAVELGIDHLKAWQAKKKKEEGKLLAKADTGAKAPLADAKSAGTNPNPEAKAKADPSPKAPDKPEKPVKIEKEKQYDFGFNPQADK
jgi:hypothetical protein